MSAEHRLESADSGQSGWTCFSVRTGATGGPDENQCLGVEHVSDKGQDFACNALRLYVRRALSRRRVVGW